MVTVLLKRLSASARVGKGRGKSNHNKGGTGTGFQNSIDMFLSDTWPYESISPLQAYLLGVFTCVVVFIAFNFFPRAAASVAAANSRHRDRDSGSRKRKTPWKRRNRNLLELESTIHSTDNNSTSSNENHNDFPKRALMLAENSLSDDKVYRRLTSRIRERAATRELRKSRRIARDAPSTATDRIFDQCSTERRITSNRHQSEGSTKLICGVDKLIARKRVWSNQKQTATYLDRKQPTAPKNGVTTASASANYTIEPSPSASTSEKSSYALLEHMNSQPLRNVTQKSCADIVHRDESTYSFNLGEVIKNKNDYYQSNRRPGKKAPSMSDKENLNMQLQSNGNTIFAIATQSSRFTFKMASQNTSLANDVSMKERKIQKDKPDCGDKSYSPSFVAVNSKEATLWSQNHSCKDIVEGTSNVDASKADDTSLRQLTSNTSARIKDQPLRGTKSIPAESGNSCDEPTLVISKARLVIMISKGVYDYVQASNQKAALDLLNDLCIPYDIIDGMDPLQREKRNAFFRVSGIRGNYPQIFSTTSSGDCYYLGGYDWLSKSKIESLKAIVNMDPKCSLASIPDPTEARLTILISKGVYDYSQAANQKAALNLLNDLCISYDVVDGMDPLQKEKRDAFFKVSGIRGNYPQIFCTAATSGTVKYLGGYDWLRGHKIEDLKRFDSK